MAQDSKTVLIVEDEEDLIEMYSMALSSQGITVLQACNGKKALEVLAENYTKIDLVLLDIVMPEMDGFETLEAIRKDDRFAAMTVMVSTNLDNDEDKQEVFKMGARDYFVKSKHTPSELVAKVVSVIEEAKAQK